MGEPKLRHSAADYPYDKTAKVEFLRGLEKLRAVKWRKVAQLLFDLFWVAERNESRMSSERRDAIEQERKDAEDWEHLQSMTDKALSGIYGQESKRIAESYLQGRARIRPNLEELRRMLRRVPGRLSG